MTKTIRPFLVTAAMIVLQSLSVQAHAQATDVDCNGCIDTQDVKFKAITTNKLDSNSVTSGKLAGNAVITSKIASEAVTTGKIDFRAVTKDKIAKNAVVTSKIKDGAVTVSKVAPELSNAIDTFCGVGDFVVGMDANGNLVCEGPAQDWTLFDFPIGTTNENNDCTGDKYVRRSDFSDFFYVGVQLCSATRYKFFMATSPGGIYWELSDRSGIGQDHCELIGVATTTAIGPTDTSQSAPSGFVRNSAGQAFEFKTPPGGSAWRTPWYECGVSIP